MAQRRAPGARYVARAVRLGILPKQSDCKCVDCGKTAARYDHRDYRKPHKVEPVCHSCDSKRFQGKPDLEEMFTDAQLMVMIRAKRRKDKSMQRVQQIRTGS